jgi:putative FmdB family regulatory protein
MPIYEYRCSSCGHELEALQKLSEAPLSTCPACARDALVKLVSAAGFQLKGSGWYATDFRSNGNKPAKPDGGDTKAADAKGADAKSESKAESKSDAAPAGGCGANCACH